MAFARFREKKEEAGELDLIPVMNLFMVLIPFLLMGAAFYHIGVIPASLPQHAEATEPAEDQEPTLTANLVLRGEALELTFSSPMVAPETLGQLGLSLARGADGFDAERIRAALIRAKASYPESKTLIVLPDEEFQYQDLVGVLDVTREREVGGLDDNGDPLTEPLFPVVVFSRFVPETESAEGGEGAAPPEGDPT